MAKKTKPRARKKAAPKKVAPKRAAPKKAAAAKPSGIDERSLKKGQLRKLTALRKSLGEGIADKAFAEWMKKGGAPVEQVDKNAELIAETLGELVNAGKLTIPRGGYRLTRGRRRVIVARVGDVVGNG